VTETNLAESPETALRRYAGILVRIGEIHQPKHLYDECGHSHSDQDVADGTAVDCGGFTSCADAYLYTVCRECCTDAVGDQAEECAAMHMHGRDEAPCKTLAAMEERT